MLPFVVLIVRRNSPLVYRISLIFLVLLLPLFSCRVLELRLVLWILLVTLGSIPAKNKGSSTRSHKFNCLNSFEAFIPQSRALILTN